MYWNTIREKTYCKTIREKFNKMIEKEREKGYAEGKEIGYAEGYAEGMEEVRAENITKLITMGRNLGTPKDEMVRQLLVLYPMAESQAWMKVEAVFEK